MGKRLCFMAGVVSFIAFFGMGLAFSQEAVVPQEDAAVIEPAPAAGLEEGQEMQWVWGEVFNLNPANNEITLKYFDYDTDQDKEILLVADSDTLYENTPSLSGIRLGDNVSIDYMVDNKGGRPVNMARNITLEPEEEIAPEEGDQPVQGDDAQMLLEEGNQPAGAGELFQEEGQLPQDQPMVLPEAGNEPPLE